MPGHHRPGAADVVEDGGAEERVALCPSGFVTTTFSVPVPPGARLDVAGNQVVCRDCAGALNDETRALVQSGDSPLEYPGQRFTDTVDESKAIRTAPRPMLVVAITMSWILYRSMRSARSARCPSAHLQ